MVAVGPLGDGDNRGNGLNGHDNGWDNPGGETAAPFGPPPDPTEVFRRRDPKRRGEGLALLRAWMGYSLEDIAASLKLTPDGVAEIERGLAVLSGPQRKTLRHLCANGSAVL